MTRLQLWWRHLHWFDVYRARDWQTVIILAGAFTVTVVAARFSRKR
jgi:hypothetical protein